MSDSSIVDPAGSSYKLPEPTETPVGDVPQMPLERVLPRQTSTGISRGTQAIISEDGVQISIGTIQDNQGFGLSMTDSTGFILFKLSGQTWYWYDKTTGKNIMQVGLLPDGSYGFAVAEADKNVSEGF